MTPQNAHLSEQMWVAQILSGTPSNETLLPDNINLLLETADRQGVAPLLHHVLLNSGDLTTLPNELQVGLSSLNRKHLAADIASRGQLCKLIELFNSHQLQFILLKGEALSHSIYPQPHLRTRCDVDLLFNDKTSTDRAWQLLKQEGYAKTVAMQGEFVGFQFTCEKYFANGVKSVLDIHHQISNYNWFNSKLTFPLLINNTESLIIDSVKVNVLSPVFALLHACMHRITNQSHDTQNRLIWLYDIHLLCNCLSAKEWQYLLKMCEKLNFSNIVLQGLQSTQAQLQTQIDIEYISALEKQSKSHSDPFTGSRRRLQMQLADLLHNKGFLNKLRHLRERLFPPADYIMQMYNLNTKKWLGFFYLKRIFNIIVRR